MCVSVWQVTAPGFIEEEEEEREGEELTATHMIDIIFSK